MSLNWTMLDPKGFPVPLPHESVITTVDSGVEVALTIPNALPSGNATAGGSGGSKRIKANGKLWLTDQRLIFTSVPTLPEIESLSIQLHSILMTKFEQPMLSGNYLAFDIRPAPEGGLTEGTSAEIRFKNRAMFEFVSLLEKTRERVIYMNRLQPEEEEGLPTYTSPADSTSASMINLNASLPADNPPGYNA